MKIKSRDLKRHSVDKEKTVFTERLSLYSFSLSNLLTCKFPCSGDFCISLPESGSITI